ncbi:MAG: DUF2207 domain-containing protein [Terricaulis sp.]
MMRALWFMIALLTLAFAAPALADERIDRFDVSIVVARSGDIRVTENIDVTAEGDQIRHGLMRDLPRYYHKDNDDLPYDYHIERVERDGQREKYDTEHEGNAFHVRIGDAHRLVSPGAHHYVIVYTVKNQVRYFDGYDEIYWNATGNFWTFPISKAQATVTLPPGGRILQTAGYIGKLGDTSKDVTYAQSGDDSVFTANRSLDAGEGLTVSVGFAKGLIDPPSAADKGWLWWQRNGALTVLTASVLGLFLFLYRGFTRVGRDPVKGPVFPRYEAPEGYSPAATHYIFHRGLRGNRALIATLMSLGAKGRLTIDARDKKVTTLTEKSGGASADAFAAEDVALQHALFAEGPVKKLGEGVDTAFTSAYVDFRKQLARKYGDAYFRWNAGYTIVSAALTIGALVWAANFSAHWTWWDSLAVLALAVLNFAFMYLMPAPTQLGQTIRTEIEGLRLYMETAEKLQLNAVKVGSDAPPPMTTERYEKFLPYAVALGVEAPWTKHFEHVLPTEAAAYHPGWYAGNFVSGNSLSHMSDSLISHIDSGVVSSMPQSSGSSGSGGGGFSGGGGGGGGGSGW